jgi:hypothetical protein
MNDQTPIERDPAIELQRNIELLKSHGQAIERLKDLEAQLRQLDVEERDAAEKYAMGYRNDPPVPRDQERSELATLLAGARVAARSATLAMPALEAHQAEIRSRIAAANSVQTTSVVEQLCAEDASDATTIEELVDHVSDLLHRQKAVRLFLSEQGRGLIGRGDVQHGTQLLQMVERLGSVRVPTFQLNAQQVARAKAEITAKFHRRKAGGP